MRVATSNIFHGPTVDGDVDLDRLRASVRGLDAALALQEVDLDQPRSGRADLTAVAADAMDAVAHRREATQRVGLWHPGVTLFPAISWQVLRWPRISFRRIWPRNSRVLSADAAPTSEYGGDVREGSASKAAYWPRVGSFRYFAADDRWEWSDEVAHMHGYEPGTVIPTTELVLSHKHPEDKSTVAELLEKVRRHGVPFSSRHRILDTAGKVHVVLVVGDLFYEDGRPAGTVGFYVDVTEQFDADVQAWLTEAITAIAHRRDVINQAIGILRWRYGISESAAFDMLTTRSQHTNIKLFEIARRFVAAATTRAGPSRFSEDRLDEMWQNAHLEKVEEERASTGDPLVS